MDVDDLLDRWRDLENYGRPLHAHRLAIMAAMREAASVRDELLVSDLPPEEVKLLIAVVEDRARTLRDTSHEIANLIAARRLGTAGAHAQAAAPEGTSGTLALRGRRLLTRKQLLDNYGLKGGWALYVLIVLAIAVKDEPLGLTREEIRERLKEFREAKLKEEGHGFLRLMKLDRRATACLDRLTDRDLVRAIGRKGGDYRFAPSPEGYVVLWRLRFVR